ncbi:hypothetical protein V6N13_068895 [Hibiscus sabdariffa]
MRVLWAGRYLRKVILEVDSADVARAVRNRRGRLSILNQVLELIDNAWAVKVCQIPRRVNRVADRLAKLAKFDRLNCDYFVVPPTEIVDLMQIDDMETVLE